MTNNETTGKWHGGKGSKVRKTSDSKKYADNYDRIFGKKSAVDDASDVMSKYNRDKGNERS